MAYNVGFAQVTVTPVFTGMQDKIRQNFNKTMPAAGKQAGNLAGGAMAGSVAASGATAAKGFSKNTAQEMQKPGTTKPFKETGKRAGGMFVGGMRSALAPLAGIFAVAGIGRFISGTIQGASDLQESFNAVEVTFGKNADGIMRLGEAAATSMGLSNEEFNGLAVRFSAFTEQIAGDGGDVVGTMETLTTRASDFASVMNLDVAEAAQLFQSGLAGESEPLRKYGIDLSAAAVEAYALSEGIHDGNGELTEAQKVQARYGLIMEQTAKTQGDFQNTSDSLANSQRILSANWTNMRAEIGNFLVPKLASLTSWANDKVLPALASLGATVRDDVLPRLQAFGDWVSEHRDPIIVIAGALTAAGTAFGTLMIANKAATAMKAFSVANWLANGSLSAQVAILRAHPIIAIISGIIGAMTLLVLAVKHLWENNETFRRIVTNAWEKIQSVISTAWTSYIKPVWDAIYGFITDSLVPAITGFWRDTIVPAWEGIRSAISTAWKSYIKPVWDAIFGFITGTLVPIFETFWGVVKIVWDNIKVHINNIWIFVQAIFYIIKGVIENILAPAFRWFFDNVIRPVWDNIRAKIDDVWLKVRIIFTAIKTFLERTLGPVFEWLYNKVIKPVWDNVSRAISTVWNDKIKPVFKAFGDFIEKTVAPAFERGVDLIKGAWNKVKGYALTPINFVIGTVYNDGIVGTFNKVAEALNLPNHLRMTEMRELSLGGSRGGGGGGRPLAARAKGGFTHPGWTLVGEEGPELVNFSSPSRVYTASDTRAMLDANPTEDKDLHGASWISDAFSKVTGWIRGGLAKAAETVLKPLRSLITANLPNRGLAGVGRAVSNKAIDSLLEWISGKDEEMMTVDPKGRGLRGAKPHVNAAAWNIADAVGGIRMMQAFNQSMAGGHPKGLAVDFIDSIPKLNAAADYMVNNGNRLGLKYLAWQGRTWAPGRGWRPQTVGYGNDPYHRWHVHGEWPTYDNGGWLTPGVQTVANRSGQPEPVLTGRQWDDIHALAQRGAGGGDTVTVLIDPSDLEGLRSVEEFTQMLRRKKRQK